MAKTIDKCVMAEDLFSGLNPENEKIIDRKLQTNMEIPDVIQTADLEKIINGYKRMEKFLKKFNNLISIGDPTDYWGGHIREIYVTACTCSPLKNISSQDITSFSIMGSDDRVNHEGSMKEKFNKKYIGLYISSLVNKCKEKEINLYLSKYKKPIDYLLYGTINKNINIMGNIGKCCGVLIKNCHVNVYGNAKDYFCDHAINSIIRLAGNSGDLIGIHTENCKIHIFGKYKSLGLYNSSEFYHKGKLICENSRRV